jgi:hypothetical protein
MFSQASASISTIALCANPAFATPRANPPTPLNNSTDVIIGIFQERYNPALELFHVVQLALPHDEKPPSIFSEFSLIS